MTPDPNKIIPAFVWVIEVPERASDLAKRWHNKYAKEALRETVEKWHDHERGFKKHYRRDARTRYRHWPRSRRYMKYKAGRFKSTVDHVLTGRSRRKMLSEYRLRIGGTAVGENLSATLILRFPFRGGTGSFYKASRNTHQAVTIEKLIIELQRFDEEDPQLLAKWFHELYMKKVDAHRAGRKRIRVS